MKAMQLFCLAGVIAVTSGGVAAQEIKDLVRIDAKNQSATPEVTRSIAGYIATRNAAPAVQTMAQPQPGEAIAAPVEVLLAAIESNARIVPQKPKAEESAPPVIKKVGTNSGGGSGPKGGGGGGW
jgi:hypothetical protein